MAARRSGLDRRSRDRNAPDRRRLGRPRLVDGEDSETLYVRVPIRLFDDVCKLANSDRRYRGNLSAVTRDALEAFLASRANSVLQK